MLISKNRFYSCCHVGDSVPPAACPWQLGCQSGQDTVHSTRVTAHKLCEFNSHHRCNAGNTGFSEFLLNPVEERGSKQRGVRFRFRIQHLNKIPLPSGKCPLRNKLDGEYLFPKRMQRLLCHGLHRDMVHWTLPGYWNLHWRLWSSPSTGLKG